MGHRDARSVEKYAKLRSAAIRAGLGVSKSMAAKLAREANEGRGGLGWALEPGSVPCNGFHEAECLRRGRMLCDERTEVWSWGKPFGAHPALLEGMRKPSAQVHQVFVTFKKWSSRNRTSAVCRCLLA